MSNARVDYAPLPQAWRARALAGASVLLETARPDGENRTSYLFTAPGQLLLAHSAAELIVLFERVEAALACGQYVAGWFSYECGYALQGLSFKVTGVPLAQLGIFDEPEIFHHQHTSAVPVFAGAQIAVPPLTLAFIPGIDPLLYKRHVDQIQQWIAAGDTYQVNYTIAATSRYQGEALSLYSSLALQQPSAYAAIVTLDPLTTVLSFSPELFFRVAGNGQIVARPMKGTMQRGEDAIEDEQRAGALLADEKSRAEHVMIVDLLRNDLGRVCEMGSVRVPDLFTVERYPTLLQMTSTVSGQLRPNLRWQSIFEALFPCGSITGAPKRHTMELIGRIEGEPRGVYTGSIGFFAPDRTAVFNVAIRTLTLQNEVARMGIGGGIVADSTAAEEYRECLLKMHFAQQASEPLQLFETLRWSGRDFPLLTGHLARMRDSANALGFPFDLQAAEMLLLQTGEAATGQAGTGEAGTGQPATGAKRVRLSLTRDGQLSMAAAPLIPWPSSLRVRLSRTIMRSSDPALRHKTTFRSVYDREFAEAGKLGMDEVVFLNDRGELSEGCISNILVKLDGGWWTPPCTSGALPGVFCRQLLQRGLARERTLSLDHLIGAEAMHLCNAVRGAAAVQTLLIGQTAHAFSTAEPIASLW